MSIVNEALKKAQDQKANLANKDLDKDAIEPKPISEIETRPKITPTRAKEAKKFIFFTIIAIIGGIIFLKNSSYLLHKKIPLNSNISTPSQEIPNSVPIVSAPKSSEGSFLPTFTLNGIVYDEVRPYAIVNNKVLLKGDLIEGAKLVEINRDSVKLIFNDKEIELTAK